ncbi:Nucleotide binding protein like [Paragonimus heterotremus]|uniref:Nucleotide binding protein like n=1 Tax=Paragonimus heterotremus TaxID=100268 RepID=A0A8J4SJP2_9TREM|nr:Nucleotide binding protein like [Paragonimus heterotremus]
MVLLRNIVVGTTTKLLVMTSQRTMAISKLPLPEVRNVLLVSSAKGGVGKSSVAVNIALALKNQLQTEPVGLLDVDVYGPSIPKMMGLEGLQPEVDSKKRILPLTSYGIKCMSMGLLVDQKSAVVWRGLMVMSAVQQLLRQVSWGPLHTLVVDMPPGTGDVQLSLCQNIPIQGVLIVTTPQAVAVADTRRGIEMLNKLKVPIYGIVENMTGYVCPACGHHSPLFSHQQTGTGRKNSTPMSGGQQLAEDTGLPVLERIPVDPLLIQTSDSGKPLVVAHPHCEVAQIYQRLAKKVIDLQIKRLEENAAEKSR